MTKKKRIQFPAVLHFHEMHGWQATEVDKGDPEADCTVYTGKPPELLDKATKLLIKAVLQWGNSKIGDKLVDTPLIDAINIYNASMEKKP